MVETANHKPLIRPDSQRPIEEEHTHERDLIIPRFDVLTFGGKSGLLKTTLAEMSAGVNKDPRNQEAQARYHLDGVAGPIKVGQWVRAETEAKTGQPFIENFEVKIEDDRRYDDEVRQIIENARKPRLVVSSEGLRSELRPASTIVEGRYTHFIAADVTELMAGHRYAPKIERVLIHSDDEVERQKVEIAREISSGRTNLTADQLIELGIARELELSRKAQILFPELVMDQYIFDPGMKTRQGNDVFTIKINAIKSDGMLKTPAELNEELYLRLKERNSIFIINRQDFAETPEGKSAYEVIKQLQHCQGLLEGNPCNRYGIRTVDVYLGNDLLVQIPACSSDHARNIQLRITKDSDEGYIFSKNGIPPYRSDEPQSIEDAESEEAKGDIFDPSIMEVKRVKEPKTNGHDKTKETVIASGMEHGEPNTRSPQPDRHPLHPSREKRRRQKKESAA